MQYLCLLSGVKLPAMLELLERASLHHRTPDYLCS